MAQGVHLPTFEERDLKYLRAGGPRLTRGRVMFFLTSSVPELLQIEHQQTLFDAMFIYIQCQRLGTKTSDGTWKSPFDSESGDSLPERGKMQNAAGQAKTEANKPM
ncbi:hypothetical protein B0H19DRAFT_1080561 [Mycena capillaripes]|nr:hypothetical protein B0H19DRAFT_1080561 [Mycena capillaripes]